MHQTHEELGLTGFSFLLLMVPDACDLSLTWTLARLGPEEQLSINPFPNRGQTSPKGCPYSINMFVSDHLFFSPLALPLFKLKSSGF